MDSLLNFDIQITSFLREIFPHIPLFDYIFSFFSLRGNSILVWILVMIIALILEERKNPGISRKDKQFAVIFLIAFLSTAIIVELPLKNFFHRQRPFLKIQNQSKIVSACPKDYSFPSGHASTAFAAATVLTFFNRKRRWFYYSVAILIAYSRIYLSCHYLIDISAGALIGYILTKLILQLGKKYYVN